MCIRDRYDEAGSGLLALLGKLGGSHVNQLRVLFGRRNAFVVQALLSQFHHPDPLFKLIADARPHISKYLSMSIVTEDDGSVKPHDYTFELDDQFVKDILAGKWDQDYHKHLLVRLYAHRSRSLAPKAVPKKKEQWLTATACTTGNQPQSHHCVASTGCLRRQTSHPFDLVVAQRCEIRGLDLFQKVGAGSTACRRVPMM